MVRKYIQTDQYIQDILNKELEQDMENYNYLPDLFMKDNLKTIKFVDKAS